MHLLDFIPEWLFNIIFPVERWLHIIASTFLIGGTLFYEFVMPIALEDLKDEHQLAVFARVRWAFARVVWFSVIVLIVTGVLSSLRHQHGYEVEFPQSGPWWIGHVALGLFSLAAALRLTLSRRMPPMSWMRMNLVFLLVVVFLATTSRHVRMTLREKMDRGAQVQPHQLRQRLPATQP